MVHDTIRKLVLTLGTIALGTLLLTPTPVGADDPDPGRPKPDSNEPRTSVQAKVESRSDGVYIRISVRQMVPSGESSAPSESGSHLTSAQRPTGSAANAAPVPATSGGTASAAPRGRTWTDAIGIHHETAEGQRISLTPPLISSATRDSWVNELRQHPDENPYLVYVDGQFGGVVWVPRSPTNDNPRFEPPPADSPPQVAVPVGDEASTGPREVALDALGHVPLPNIQVRMNPALGLVAMPGWFWVEGYDGTPFGTSRTVSIPPEIGPEIPADVVPADDPRRQGSSFTVEVRVWPSSYEWNFGDGASLVTQSLGKRYPAESDIQHTYEYSSLPFPNGFPVRLTVEFAAEFRVNGGPPQRLPPIRRTYETGYRVQEIQPVLTGR